MNKKLGWVIGVSLLLLGCSGYLITYHILSDKKKDSDSDENLNSNLQNTYSYDVKDEEIIFYYTKENEKKVISTYQCKKVGCAIGTSQNYSGFDQQTGITLIRDNIITEVEYKADYILFDTNKGTELVSSSSVIYPIFNYIYPEDNQNESYVDVAGYRYITSNNKISLVYSNGTKLVNGYDFDEVYTGHINTIYLYEKLQYLYLGVKKNDKWGIIDFRANGDVVLDCEYDDINIFNSYNIAVKKGATWSVIDRDKKEVGAGYQELYIYDKYYLASINNKINLYDETGVMIGNINLDLGLPYDHSDDLLNGLFLSKTDNDMVLEISIDYATNEEYKYTNKTYHYDLTTNKLTEINNQ